MPLVFAPASSTDGGARLDVIDYRAEARSSSPATSNGVCLVEFDPVPAGYLWRVERVTVSNTSTTATQARTYAGGVSPSNFVDGTISGNLDTADNASPVLVDSNAVYTVQWTGASTGAVGTVRVQYSLVQRS